MVSRRCREPVTFWAAPKNFSFICIFKPVVITSDFGVLILEVATGSVKQRAFWLLFWRWSSFLRELMVIEDIIARVFFKQGRETKGMSNGEKF